VLGIIRAPGSRRIAPGAGRALTYFERRRFAFGRPGLMGVAALVGVGIVSVAIALWTVRGYA